MHEEMVLASLELDVMENRPTVCTRPRR